MTKGEFEAKGKAPALTVRERAALIAFRLVMRHNFSRTIDIASPSRVAGAAVKYADDLVKALSERPGVVSPTGEIDAEKLETLAARWIQDQNFVAPMEPIPAFGERLSAFQAGYRAALKSGTESKP